MGFSLWIGFGYRCCLVVIIVFIRYFVDLRASFALN